MSESIYSQGSSNEAAFILQTEKRIRAQVQDIENYEVEKKYSVWPEDSSGIESEAIEKSTYLIYSSKGKRQVVTINEVSYVGSGPFYFCTNEEHYYHEGRLYFVFVRKSSAIRNSEPKETIEVTEYKIYFPEPISLAGDEKQREPSSIPFIVLHRTYSSIPKLIYPIHSKEKNIAGLDDIESVFDTSVMGYGRFINLFPEYSFEKKKIEQELKKTNALVDAINRNGLLFSHIARR